MPRFPIPAIPPNPPRPKGDCPTLGGGGAVFGVDEVVVGDGVDPAAGAGVVAEEEEPAAELAAPPCLMTR